MIAGTDEVGRGCLAGAVVAAAVILKEDISGLTDSKKISPKKRQSLADLILKCLLIFMKNIWIINFIIYIKII